MPFRFADTTPRRWGTRFDSLTSSPPSEPASTVGSTQTEPFLSHRQGHSDIPYLSKENEKMPHDASIFVGSLPSSVEQRELTRALTEHLSEHAVIRNVKVVRDARGSVCAFVQCENAAAANKLIETLQSRPSQPFLGRYLRYEKARSLRSLLLSYRAPTQYIPPPAINSSNIVSNFDESAQGFTVPIEPATAMRIFRDQGARYLSVIYNEEARNSPCNEEKGLLLSPLKFDAESISKIVASFGAVDGISLFKSNDAIQPPHDAPRAPGMALGIWEVKFNHRSDALSALMTLRTVPHLTITWTHQTYERSFKQHNPEEGPSSAPESLPRFNDSRRASCWTPHARVTPSTESTSPVHDPVQFPSILSKSTLTSEEDLDDDSVVTSRLPSFSDDDFPPLMGKKTSWADDAVIVHDDSVFGLTTDVSSEYADHVPITPDFTTSSITPLTPKTASGFPRTPRSANIETVSNGCDGPHFDPTSLFIGGLPAHWEEENVREIFHRFPGLESVKVIRPMTKKGTAFAFVKFDNTDSPQQAILEEHDRVRDRRHIRVQLRDMNPPGRYGRKRRFPYHGTPDIHGDVPMNGLTLDMMGFSNHRDEAPVVDTVQVATPQNNFTSSTQERTIEFPHSPIEAEPLGILSSSSVSTSPHPSSDNSGLVQAPALMPYPVPYYAPAPWITGYPPPYTYPVHYIPGYPTFAPTSSYMPSTSSVVPGTYAMMPPPTDPASSQQRPAQPPLQPSGFIQGEQGTLIPVYPTEALEKYMSDPRHVGATASPSSLPDVPTQVSASTSSQFSHQSQPPALPYSYQHPLGWGLAPRQPIPHHLPGSYMHASPVASVLPSSGVHHQSQSFPTAPGFHQMQQHDYRGGGKRHNYRQYNNNFSNNRNNAANPSLSLHNHHHHQHRMPYAASSNGAGNSYENYVQRQHVPGAAAQDWTMWTGNR